MIKPILSLVLLLAGLQGAPQQQQPGQVGQRGRGAQPAQQQQQQPRGQGQQPVRQPTPGTVRVGAQSPLPAVAGAGGRVTRVDTGERLPNVRVELGGGSQRQPTGYDKPCKPQTVIEPDRGRYAISDKNGEFFFEGGTAQEPATPQEDETTRQILELERLRRLAERGVTGVPEQENRNPRDANRPANTLLTDLPAVNAVTYASGPKFRGEREGFVQVPWAPPIGMAPAPTISGSIIDASQKPVTAAVVQAYSVHYTPLGRSLKWVKSTLTNDLGDYRLSWLPFGRYFVVAGHSNYVLEPWAEGLRTTPNLPESDLGSPLLFYPGVFAAQDAQLVTLSAPTVSRPEMPAPVANLVLRARPRFNVKIRLVADPLPSNPNLVFLPYGGDLCAGMDYAIKANSDGTFDVRDVPEGRYVLAVIRGRDTISELMPVNVNKNIDDLKIPTIPPSEIRGTMTFTGATPGLDLSPILQNLRVNLTRAGSEVSHVATTLMDPDTHNFTIPGMGPGFYYPTLDLPRGSYIKNIRVMKFNRVVGVSAEKWTCDALPAAPYSYLNANGHLQPLEIAKMIPGEIPSDPSCLNIEVSFEGQLMGRALAPVCAPPPAPCPTPMGGSMIVLIPRSAFVRHSPSDITPPDRILTTMSGEGGPGRWEFRGLPMDENYLVFSIPGLDPDVVYAPRLQEVLNSYALVVSGVTNPCPEYRRSIPEGDPYLLSRCEVTTPSEEVLTDARERVFR